MNRQLYTSTRGYGSHSSLGMFHAYAEPLRVYNQHWADYRWSVDEINKRLHKQR